MAQTGDGNFQQQVVWFEVLGLGGVDVPELVRFVEFDDLAGPHLLRDCLLFGCHGGVYCSLYCYTRRW